MPQFRVTLTASASVHQHQWITAANAQEASDLAKERFNDNEWKYDGVDDDTVEVVSADLDE